MRVAPILMLGAAAAACVPASVPTMLSPATPVMATAETAPVGTANADAADDPAIWRNPGDPSSSLIVATDKKAGLYVYDLDGKVRSFDAAGQLNNVDLVDLGARGILVVASDRNDPANARLRFYRLEPATATLVPVGLLPAGTGEAYGVCLAAADDGSIQVFSVLKSGTIEQIALAFDGTAVTGKTVRSLSVPTQPEGCAVDTRTNTLFVGEEKAGIWRFDSRADGPDAGELVARVDNKHLFADVEGLALAPEGSNGGLLIASSQGDNAFALYRLPDMTPAGRFRIVKGKLGSVEETDGIALALGDFGSSYQGGLFVAQDGMNEPHAQNFKLLPWAAIIEVLGIK